MKRTQILTALACALLALGLVACGGNNRLQSIQLNVAQINGTTPTNGSVLTLQGIGSTIQLQAVGEYSSGKTKVLTNEVTYNVVVDNTWGTNDQGQALLPPCSPPTCPSPTGGPYTAGTLEYSPTGLITAVEPAECTWENQAVDPATTPAWAIVGEYDITVSFEGVTSQPVYIPVASAVGIYDKDSNPTSACGPSPTTGG